MRRLMAAIGGLIVYLSIGTILAQAIIIGYATSKGLLNRQKLTDMLAVARGASLSSTDQKMEQKLSKPTDMLSIDEQDQLRTTKSRHLELREQAVQNALEQIAAERDKLLKDRQTYDMLVAAFVKEKEVTENRKLDRGAEEARSILENVKPKLAKDLILKMIEADEKDEAVEILSAMPIAKQVKIAQEFKTDEDKKKLDDIMRRVRQRPTAKPSGGALNESATPTDLRQP